MNDPHFTLNEQIKKEADIILNEQGLSAILSLYGHVHISGSYSLDLMVWRDLDIYIETENITEEIFFQLGGKIATALHPIKMSFRNEIIKKTIGLPYGLYWGIYLGNERDGAWKIDIWAIDSKECQKLLDYCAALQEKLTPINALQILQIKSHCWKDPNYRRSYSSKDIYKAVFEHSVTDVQGFQNYLMEILV